MATDIASLDLKGMQFAPDETEVDQLASVPTLTIDSAEAYQHGAEILRGVAALIRKIEDHYENILKPLNAARTNIHAMRHEQVDPLLAIKSELSAKLAIWDDEQKRIEQEARQKAEQEALERARQQRDAEIAAIAAQEQALDDPLKRRALRHERSAVAAQPIVAEKVSPAVMRVRVGGVSHSARYVGECFDVRAFAKEIAEGRISDGAIVGLVPVERDSKTLTSPWLNREATQRRDSFNIPGCRARRVPGTSARA